MTRKFFYGKLDFFLIVFLLKKGGKNTFLGENELFYVLISRNATKQYAPHFTDLAYKVCKVTCESLSVKISLSFDSEASRDSSAHYMYKGRNKAQVALFRGENEKKSGGVPKSFWATQKHVHREHFQKKLPDFDQGVESYDFDF